MKNNCFTCPTCFTPGTLGTVEHFGPMLPDSTGSADASVIKKSGTCSSVSLCLRYAASQTARPATFIATLRCKTVSEQVCHRLADAPPHRLKEKRSRPAVGCSGRCAPSTTASSPCWLMPSRPPTGRRIIARERPTSATVSAPNPRTLT